MLAHILYNYAAKLATFEANISIQHIARAGYSTAADITNTVLMATENHINGDINNTNVLRETKLIAVDLAYAERTLAIPEHEDAADIRARYRPFLQRDDVAKRDWVAKLELSTALKMAEAQLMENGGDRIKVLALYGSMRQRSYSRLLTLECARILWRLGCDVRIFDPTGLPVKDDIQHDHHKVQELRDLSKWSDGHIWISPEQHGNLVCLFPLLLGLHISRSLLIRAIDRRIQKSN